MRALASFIMNRRIQAVFAAAGFALLGLLLPPAGYLSGAAVALVTLRLGALQGLLIVLGAIASVGAFGSLTWGDGTLSLVFALGMWLPLWLLALVWRGTVSLNGTLLAAAGIGVLLALAMHWVLQDPVAWWRGFLEVLRPAMEQAGVFKDGEGVERAMDGMARIMTGLMSAALVISLMLSLFIARWWQAALYNPGGFRREFHALRIDRRAAVVLVALLALSLIGGDGVRALATDLVMVGIVVYLFQGLALVHGMVAAFRANPFWLVGLYGLMVLASPHMVMLLSAMGFADTWFDFRARFPTPEN